MVKPTRSNEEIGDIKRKLDVALDMLEEKGASRLDAERDIALRVAKRRPLVLIVDDDPKIRELLRRVLTAVEVTEAANGKEALLKVSQKQPDLVITDIKMPEMDGFTLLTHLRDRCPELKVMAVSSYVGAETFDHCTFDGFISNPTSMAEILSKVNNMLGMRS